MVDLCCLRTRITSSNSAPACVKKTQQREKGRHNNNNSDDQNNKATNGTSSPHDSKDGGAKARMGRLLLLQYTKLCGTTTRFWLTSRIYSYQREACHFCCLKRRLGIEVSVVPYCSVIPVNQRLSFLGDPQRGTSFCRFPRPWRLY